MPDALEAGKRLKDAREAAGRTLGELSRATRINEKFLSEIEEGRAFSLPAVYRRTFIRTYARELGIDPDEVTPEEIPAASPAGTAEQGRDAAAAPVFAAGPPVERGVEAPVSGSPFAEMSQIRTMAIIVVLLLTALVLSIKWLGSDGGDAPAPAPAGATDAGGWDTAGAGRPQALSGREGAGALRTGRTPPADTLVLHATTTESVWVHVVIDNDSTLEYTLPPGYALTLRATENFLLAVGNPAGIEISLNGRDIAIRGERNRPLKNVFLSRKSIPE
jgi:cytoskeleton protein RodZ